MDVLKVKDVESSKGKDWVEFSEGRELKLMCNE